MHGSNKLQDWLRQTLVGATTHVGSNSFPPLFDCAAYPYVCNLQKQLTSDIYKKNPLHKPLTVGCKNDSTHSHLTHL